MMRHTVVVVAVICALGLSRTAGAEEKVAGGAGAKAVEEAAVDRQLDRKLPEINFGGQQLVDVMDFLCDVSGANIYVDWKRMEESGIRKDTAVSLRLKDVQFRAALNSLLALVSNDKGKAQFSVDEGVIVITTAEDPEHPRAKVTIGTMPEKFDRRLPEINFNGQGFGDVIDFLRDISGANIVVDWKKLEKAGIGRDSPISARLKDVRISTALRRILEEASDRKTPVQAAFADNIVTITTGPDAPPTGKPAGAAATAKPVDAKPAKPENDGK
jgi:hypothetical protein